MTSSSGRSSARANVRRAPLCDDQGHPVLAWSFRVLPRSGPVRDRYHAALGELIALGQAARRRSGGEGPAPIPAIMETQR